MQPGHRDKRLSAAVRRKRRLPPPSSAMRKPAQKQALCRMLHALEMRRGGTRTCAGAHGGRRGGSGTARRFSHFKPELLGITTFNISDITPAKYRASAHLANIPPRDFCYAGRAVRPVFGRCRTLHFNDEFGTAVNLAPVERPHPHRNLHRRHFFFCLCLFPLSA